MYLEPVSLKNILNDTKNVERMTIFPYCISETDDDIEITAMVADTR